MSPDLLSALAAYIPRDRVAAILDPEATLAHDGIALIADITGFMALTEALAQNLRPDQGAEELTRILTRVFTPLIDEVHAYGGSVIKFGGDALIVWFGRRRRGWRSAVIRRALTAAWKMQQVMKTQGSLSTTVGAVALEMTVGLAYGPVMRLNLGVPEYGYEDVLVGATLDRMATAEEQAQPGEIVVDAATLAHVPDADTETRWRGDFAAITRLLRPSRPNPNPSPSWPADSDPALVNSLAAYVPRPIVETLRVGQSQVAELKPVLSLFVQFHGLDYETDPDIADKLQTYFATAQQVVARYDGRLNRLITGDKGSLLHIIFGAPRSVEEQEERAVRCALDLQVECRALPFITGQRIGITSGRVFAGPVGSPLRHDYTTMGDAINLSARLMQNATPDQILMDAAVRQQLSAAIKVTDLGYIRVKGKSEPIHVYSADSFQQPVRELRQVEQPFGRDREISVIRNQLSAISQPVAGHRLPGSGGIITVVGEVGLGKTLLLDNIRYETERAWRPHPDGGMWASGINPAYGNTFTGYLFIDLLRDLLNVPSGATPHHTSRRLQDFCEELFGDGRLESTYPYLAKFMNLPLPDDLEERLEGLAGESLRWQLFELVPDLLRHLCTHFPVVLALDDLQWADPTSLQLLQRLAPLTTEIPLLLLLALRPEIDTRAWELVEGWDTAVVPHTQLTLNPLDDRTAAELIRHHLPDLPPRIVTYLVQKGGGNPLFLVELARTLQLTGEADIAQIELDALDLPNSVQGLLLAQLDRLAVESRHTLQLASVIGKTFLDQVLASISTAEQQVTDLLAELTEQDYVRPDRADLGDAHSFRHSLIQESAYSTLLHERRRAYHRQVAEAFEQLFPAAIAEQAAFLAYHYEQAEDLDNAVYYLNQTADQARLLYAHEEAELLYQRILTLLQRMPETNENLEGQARTYLKLAQVKVNVLEFEGAQTYYEFAFDLLDQVERSRGREAQADAADIPVFRWGVPEEFTKNLDPAYVDNEFSLQLILNLFEGLVELDNDWNIIPVLAVRWQVLDDGLRYQFKLRQDWRWSDGVQVTAHDFVFAWRRNLSPQINAGMVQHLFPIKGALAYHQGENTSPLTVGVKALDDWTLEIRLDNPVNYFLYILAYPVTFPQPAHQVQQNPETWASPDKLVCNGPFLVKVDSTDHNEINLIRNPQYRGLSAGNLKRVNLKFQVPNLQNYQQNEVDWCRVDDRADLALQYPESAFLVQGFITFFLGFACHVAPFYQKRIRKAFTHVINRRELVKVVWADVQKPATGGFVPPGMPGHSPEIGLTFDPLLGRQLLSEAGYPDGESFPDISMAYYPGFADTPKYLRRIWQTQLGVSVNLLEDLTPDNILQTFKKGEAHLILIGWYVAFPDPDDVLRGLFHSGSPNNIFNWKSSQFDNLLEQAQAVSDSIDRFNLYHKADQLLIRTETAVAPLYYLQAHGLLRPPFRFKDIGKIIRHGNIKFKNIEVH